jgi:hypothetical protein
VTKWSEDYILKKIYSLISHNRYGQMNSGFRFPHDSSILKSFVILGWHKAGHKVKNK